MKINKKCSAVIEWVLAIFLLGVCFKYLFLSCGSFSPIKAYEQSERTFHYGPSEIIKTIDFKGGKIYLCKYKQWFSVNTVKKEMIKWYPGDQVAGREIDYSKKVTYSWSNSRIKDDVRIMNMYGYVNDPNIVTMLLEVEGENNRDTLKYNLDENKMFIFYWNEKEEKYKMNFLKGIDKKGKVIYEEELY